MKRRGFLLGLGATFAAPAIVRADSLMKIAVLRESVVPPLVVTPWVSYTPTLVGFGSYVKSTVWSRRVGDALEIMGTLDDNHVRVAVPFLSDASRSPA